MASVRHRWLDAPAVAARAALDVVDWPMRALQRAVGVPRIAWLFVGPNLLILGLFTFLPIAVDFHFAVTSGVELYPWRRPYTGAENLATLFECGNFFDPSTCRKDLFWRAVYNTAMFAAVQVGLMIAFALITALVLNRKFRGRGFFRGVFFYPVLLSPVVVALIWKWMLQREGVLNAVLVGAGASPVGWLSDATWAFFWCVFVSIWAHMGFYTLILLAGLQAIPADLYEAAEMDGTSPWRRVLADHAAAADAESHRRPRSRPDPRSAGFRRGVRADRRRPRLRRRPSSCSSSTRRHSPKRSINTVSPRPRRSCWRSRCSR